MKCWSHYNKHGTSAERNYIHQGQINMVFANHMIEDAIYEFAVKEIAKGQKKDAALKKLSMHDKYSTQLVEDTQILCKGCKMAKQ